MGGRKTILDGGFSSNFDRLSPTKTKTNNQRREKPRRKEFIPTREDPDGALAVCYLYMPWVEKEKTKVKFSGEINIKRKEEERAFFFVIDREFEDCRTSA